MTEKTREWVALTILWSAVGIILGNLLVYGLRIVNYIYTGEWI